MSIEVLQEEIVSNGGWILSDGTLNLEHLLPKAYDLLRNIEGERAEKIRQDILSVFTFVEGEEIVGDESLFIKQYYDDAEIEDENMQDADYIWNETVFNFFMELSPDNYYFGSNEGDGACIGWFKEHMCSCCFSEFVEINDDGLCSECSEEDEERAI